MLSSGLWFISCLFISQLFLYLTIKIFKNSSKKIIKALVFLSVLGYVYVTFVNKIFFWSIDASLIAVGFLGMGYLAKKYELLNARLLRYKWFIVCAVINIFVTYINIYFGWENDLYSNTLSIYPVYYIGAISGIIASIIFVNIILKNNMILRFCGLNSIVFYAFHKYIYTVVNSYFVVSIQNTLIKGILYVGIAYLGCGVASIIINKWAPWILGKYNIKRIKKEV